MGEESRGERSLTVSLRTPIYHSRRERAMETLSRARRERLHTANTERLRSPLLLLEGQKKPHSSQRHTQALQCVFQSWVGQRTKHFDCVPKYTTTLIEISAASMKREQKWKQRREKFSKSCLPLKRKEGSNEKATFSGQALTYTDSQFFTLNRCCRSLMAGQAAKHKCLC